MVRFRIDDAVDALRAKVPLKGYDDILGQGIELSGRYNSVSNSSQAGLS